MRSLVYGLILASSLPLSSSSALPPRLATLSDGSSALRGSGSLDLRQQGQKDHLRGGGGGRRQAPTVCEDTPKGWSDVTGNSCANYGASQYCTADGGYGPGWLVAVWGSFESYASEGKIATEVCCACGGGTSGPAPACASLECPQGFSLKSGSDALYCKGLTCSVSVDMDTCCEAPPEVKAAVDEAKAELASLKTEVLNNLTLAGDSTRKALLADGTSASGTLANQFKADAAKQRNEAIQAATSHFGSLTAHASNLQTAAQYQITMTGFFAARATAASAEGRPNGERLQTLSTQAADGFAAAADAWVAVSADGKDVMDQGEQEWAKYHSDLNTTWPKLLEGITSVNTALKASEVPAHEVRWSEQATRLASDFSQVARTQADSLATQVKSAAERASAARQATGANADLLDDLEALTDKAEEAAAKAAGSL